MYLGYQDNVIKFFVEEPLDPNFYPVDEWVETEDDYALDGDHYVIKDQAWEEEQARREAERIAKLHLTRGDVFRALLMARGVTRAQLRAMIEQLPDNTTEQSIAKEMALIDFDEALEFYRGVSLIDTLGSALGISSQQMTRFFETNDYHELM